MNTQSVVSTQNEVNVDFLQAFSDAWNNHDIDALMSFVTDDCIFHTAAGADLQGNTFSGREAVRESFQQVWRNFPDAAWLDGDHFISGDRAVSESTFCATKPDGSRIEARMVDVFTLEDGKIKVKNAFRKDRPAFFENN
ncbi:nuclear transport factor 2 family protein [Photobacterium makurazakiensis]|uniref:nuclear transport factor 2 family protein n=1 Tax=Photobacterium makurazakiensis TaxID=2910234 RepID=UPI003D0A80DF